MTVQSRRIRDVTADGAVLCEWVTTPDLGLEFGYPPDFEIPLGTRRQHLDAEGAWQTRLLRGQHGWEPQDVTEPPPDIPDTPS